MRRYRFSLLVATNSTGKFLFPCCQEIGNFNYFACIISVRYLCNRFFLSMSATFSCTSVSRRAGSSASRISGYFAVIPTVRNHAYRRRFSLITSFYRTSVSHRSFRKTRCFFCYPSAIPYVIVLRNTFAATSNQPQKHTSRHHCRKKFN